METITENKNQSKCRVGGGEEGQDKRTHLQYNSCTYTRESRITVEEGMEK